MACSSLCPFFHWYSGTFFLFIWVLMLIKKKKAKANKQRKCLVTKKTCGEDSKVHCGWTRLQLSWSATNIIKGWRWDSHGTRAALVSKAYCHLPPWLGFPKCTVPFRSPGSRNSWGLSFPCLASEHRHSCLTMRAWECPRFSWILSASCQCYRRTFECYWGKWNSRKIMGVDGGPTGH